MRFGRPGNGRTDAGFTLAELLVAITILGIIATALAESVLIGVKTTAATGTRVSGSVALEALGSYFVGDAQSARSAYSTDTVCATSDNGVFLHLSWTDQGNDVDVSYALDPPGAQSEQDLIRTACRRPTGSTSAVTPDRRILGHFSHDPSVAPVLAFCGPDENPISVCPAAPPAAVPASFTMAVLSDTTLKPPPHRTDLTVLRRST